VLGSAIGFWAVLTWLSVMLHDGVGLRGQYFTDAEFRNAPLLTQIDARVTTAQVFRRWNAAPPESFAVQWSGYLLIDRPGTYTFTTTSDREARLFIDKRLIVDANTEGEPATQSGHVDLTTGAHPLVLQYAHNGGRSVIEWEWTPPGGTRSAVPVTRLSPTSDSDTLPLVKTVDGLWWGVVVIAIGAMVWSAYEYWSAVRPRTGKWLALRAALLLALSVFYVAGATEHARSVNTFKARGDQNAYLWDAQQVYANANGRQPPMLIGARARMPIYAGFLSLAYTPKLTDPEFFEVAKIWNIRLSVVLLAMLCVVFAWHLPPLVSFNLSLVVAFGYFVFKAGYSQPELLFYTFFFATFLGCWHLLRGRSGPLGLAIGIAAGVFAGLAYLTKALVPPFLVLFVTVYLLQETWTWLSALRHAGTRDPIARHAALTRFRWSVLTAVAFTTCFFLVVSQYVIHNKRFFGDYFFNLNTTYYVWYDTGVEGRAIIAPDDEGHPHALPEQFASLQTYWRSHTMGQMVDRLIDGLADTADRSYRNYGFLKYAALYAAIVILLLVSNPRPAIDLVRSHAGLAVFLLLYAAIYLAATAFFVTTSSTGAMRFLLAHAAPFFFVLSQLVARAPFDRTVWRPGGLRLAAAHLNVLVLIVVAVDLSLFLWPRLMSTYGGF